MATSRYKRCSHKRTSSSLFLSVTIGFVIFTGGCGNKKSEKRTVDSQPTRPAVVVPDFNADSAYRFVEAQCEFGPRVPNTKPHEACGDYLIAKMKTYADTVIIQKGQVTTFNNIRLNIRNIICQFNPAMQNRILFFAHWDTRPWADQDTQRKDEPILGADDAGSGVGVLLEMARVLAEHRPGVGIDIILFDAEDYGTRREDESANDSYALGTQYWCNNPLPENYMANYGVLLDMVGARNATFHIEGYSKQYASFVVEKIWRTANRIGYSSYFPYADGGYVTDDHYYPNTILNIPCADIINNNPDMTRTGFAEHWHTHRDNMEIIDRNTLKAVGQTLLHVIFEEPNV